MGGGGGGGFKKTPAGHIIDMADVVGVVGAIGAGKQRWWVPSLSLSWWLW